MTNTTQAQAQYQEIIAILNRIENAKRCTSAMLEKSQEFAQFVESQMDDLGINSLLSGKYRLITITSNVGKDTSLYLNTGIDRGYDVLHVCLDVKSIDAHRDEYYLHGDYHASYNKPNRGDIMTFVMDARLILDELASFDKTIDTNAIDSVIK